MILAVKSLNGGDYHLEGEVFQDTKTIRRYKQAERKCYTCGGVGHSKQYIYYAIEGQSYGNQRYEDAPCRECKGEGIVKYNVLDKERTEEVPVERQRSLCGRAILRPKTKGNIKELENLNPLTRTYETHKGETKSYTYDPCCSACMSVYRLFYVASDSRTT